ncbi:polysaccharide deacetylase family protein [Halorientalis halophila]|uniref:polysaccharide deacetylase family protein n=1 Tax=Halorientalis halophila TaxID=3108499 RepID=UPI00300865E0
MTPVPAPFAESADSRSWPESRPGAWHALASLEQRTRFASLFGNRRDAVLLYHSVGGVPGIDYRWDVPVHVFRDQIRRIAARYELVDLETLATTETSTKRVAITFDDGFRNVYEHALPVLSEFDAPATLFVNSAFVDDENLDRLRERHDLGAAAHDVSLTTDQLQEIAAQDRYTIGNHTFSHANLAELPDRGAVAAEILDAKEWLEDRLDVAVDCFSYPYGGFDERAAEVVAETHEIAVTSEPSLVGPSPNPLAIPRLDACLPASTVAFEVTDVAARLRSLVRRVG